MNDDAYSIIRKIEGIGGNVVITISDNNITKEIVVTVDEALDRAEAIGGMKLENEIRQGQTSEICSAFMHAAAEARAQQEKMARDGEFVDFKLKEKNRRALELKIGY